MRLFLLRSFSKWAKAQRINDRQLIQAISEVIDGLVDANLGGGILKKRIARRGFGKRSGYRTLLAFKSGKIVIFLFGFSKNEKDNIENSQLIKLKSLAKFYLQLSNMEIDRLIKLGKIIEVSQNEKNKKNSK